MRTFCEQNFFSTNTSYFIWLSVGIVDISFQSAGTDTPTWHLNFHFRPLTVSYEHFPWWNQRQLDFFSIEPNSILQFSTQKLKLLPEKELLSGHYAAYSAVAGTCYTTRCTTRSGLTQDDLHLHQLLCMDVWPYFNCINTYYMRNVLE